jgi:hypothetical protein
MPCVLLVAAERIKFVRTQCIGDTVDCCRLSRRVQLLLISVISPGVGLLSSLKTVWLSVAGPEVVQVVKLICAMQLFGVNAYYVEVRLSWTIRMLLLLTPFCVKLLC